MKYVFDTNIISALMRRDAFARVSQLLARTRVEDQCTTSITAGELRYGALRVGRPELWTRARVILQSLTVLSFDGHAAEFYGELRARLEKRGAILEEADLRIAAIALAHDCTLVTGNVKHFKRVEGLRVEDWL